MAGNCTILASLTTSCSYHRALARRSEFWPCGNVSLQVDLTKKIFMRNGRASDAPFSLNGTNISECSSYVYLGREVNMANDLVPDLGGRKRAYWGAFNSVEEVAQKTKKRRRASEE